VCYAIWHGKKAELSSDKFGSWQLGVEGNDEVVARTIQSTLARGARRLWKARAAEIAVAREAEQFSLANGFPKLREVYLFHRTEATLAREAPLIQATESQEEQPFGAFAQELGTQLNADLERRSTAVYHGFAAVGAFFSALEVWLDACFVLANPRPSTFAAFASEKWRERFKAVVDLQRPSAKRQYDTMLTIKEGVRDRLLHGLNKERRIIVHLRSGAIPLDHDYLNDALYNAPLWAAWEPISDALQAFDTFDDWASSESPYAEAWSLASSGFELPLSGPWRERLMEWLAAGSLEEFQSMFEHESRYRDDLANSKYEG